MDWTDDINTCLENIRVNSVNLSEYYRKQHLYWKNYAKYFRFPMILLSSVSATSSVGLTGMMKQENISLLTCGLGMIMGIITSFELYLNIATNVEKSLQASSQFYLLSIDIYKTLSLLPVNRGSDALTYLSDKYADYCKIKEFSNITKRKLKDVLQPINADLIDKSIISSRATTPSGSEDNV